jgi:4-hydroxy-tetrahydrodipicolinate synthase
MDVQGIRIDAEYRPMSTKGEQFAGVTVALVTPFRNGEIDFADLNRLVDWHVE